MLRFQAASVLRLCLGLLSVIVLTGCNDDQGTVSPAVHEIERPARIEPVTSASATGLVFNGTVRAAQRAEMAFKVAGRIDKLLVNEGDRVSQGDLLAQLDDRQFRTALASAQAEYASANADYQRGLTIFKRSQAISKSDLEKLATQQNLASNRLKEAQLALDEARLTAPFDGVIGRKLVEDFARVNANQTVLVLQNLQDLEIVIQVPDQVILRRQREHQLVARVAGLEREFPLSLRFFATEADAVTQTYQVVFGLEQKGDIPVLPGMSAQVYAIGSSSNNEARVTVPLSAIIPDNQGQQSVWLVNDQGRTERRGVEVGPLLGDRAVITQGLALGDRIITAGVASVREGMPVRPLNEQE
ncbi:efflux RND transporter periplasmic adaptor subunit [Marinobacterium sediminicola]|uniref:RND family efflux transporter, MFP subunit n=1 Tax=Marinobacterium sediminicola TaxID=518898 RepID=A0ABY1S332_9GAMM|nr:efflux RND transporter periplasmic adaptor subunit [Marinobacterium sediminicola]ULG68154.1 efflux RND transporter periplasmic adaptor subunit [Marinobacterium sediminicola]SMR77679.1 RND family efflux transporter, MFP subunit [Marinobacterium sediminicola]